MTTTPSTGPEGDLDRFETALLTELRAVVTDRRPAQQRKRTLAFGGVAASAVAAMAIGLAVGGSSPAFAVHREADGDISVTINRLEDADGLERALAAQGVTADVDYTHPIAMKTTDGRTLDVIPLPVQQGIPEGETVDCDFGLGSDITLDTVDDGYRVTIPAESVLTHTPLRITTAETADHHPSLAVSYNQGRCGVVAQKSDG